MNGFEVVIVGAGHAGAQAAIQLRQMGFGGSVALIGDEPLPPYERPPLSKEYLLGEKSAARLLIRPEGFWLTNDVTLILGQRVVEVLPAEHRVVLTDGRKVEYRKLIWATGGAPRRLGCPGANASSVHAIRTLADIDAIMARLPQVKRVAVVGGGYIGLEAAAALRKLKKQVVVLEALDRVLSRVAGWAISDFFAAKHRTQGVDVRTNVKVKCIEDDNSLLLASGERIAADLIIAGIGIDPAVEPLMAAGATGGNGVDVDGFCRTALKDIYAIGDCASHENAFAGGRRIRLESVQNANDQAKTAVHHIMDDAKPYSAVPWFWSNQYDVKLQTIGLSIDHDDAEVRGDPASGSFSVAYFRCGRPIAVDCVNSPRAFVHGRAEILAAAQRAPTLATSRLPADV